MALKCGIVGLPNVGKSTLFNALTAAKALAANYPFATKEPNVGIVTVPDPRLDKLVAIVKPKSIVPTTIEIVDIAGLIKGASQGEGLGNQFLANIREVDAIIHVVRCFEDGQIVHVDGSIDPVRDQEIIETELILKDLETMEKRIEKLNKQAKTGTKEAKVAVEYAQEIIASLESGMPARLANLNEGAQEMVAEAMLLTSKPVLYACNVDEGSALKGNAFTAAFDKAIENDPSERIIICAGIEADIAELEDPSDRAEFLEEMGLDEPGLHRMIRASYKLLNLITYFTAGEKEARAWTVKRGSRAPEAAGVIHSDFEKGFIRAEVIKYDDMVHLGSEVAVKEAGKMSVEGKEYIVQDGDIMHFRFNV
ncbi:MAG: redox-regulated ATPase YchF [Saprospiraceae bacterium]|nr:redox-regulated ATPase YchF [Saprospiraceae bacterium]